MNADKIFIVMIIASMIVTIIGIGYEYGHAKNEMLTTVPENPCNQCLKYCK